MTAWFLLTDSAARPRPPSPTPRVAMTGDSATPAAMAAPIPPPGIPPAPARPLNPARAAAASTPAFFAASPCFFSANSASSAPSARPCSASSRILSALASASVAPADVAAAFRCFSSVSLSIRTPRAASTELSDTPRMSPLSRSAPEDPNRNVRSATSRRLPVDLVRHALQRRLQVPRHLQVRVPGRAGEPPRMHLLRVPVLTVVTRSGVAELPRVDAAQAAALPAPRDQRYPGLAPGRAHRHRQVQVRVQLIRVPVGQMGVQPGPDLLLRGFDAAAHRRGELPEQLPVSLPPQLAGDRLQLRRHVVQPGH